MIEIIPYLAKILLFYDSGCTSTGQERASRVLRARLNRAARGRCARNKRGIATAYSTTTGFLHRRAATVRFPIITHNSAAGV